MAKYFDLTDTRKNCRVCLERTSALISLTSIIYFDKDGFLTKTTIEEVLSILYPQKLDVGYPSGICNQCKRLVEATFELKTRLDTSAIILQELIEDKFIDTNKYIEDKSTKEHKDHTYFFHEDLVDNGADDDLVDNGAADDLVDDDEDLIEDKSEGTTVSVHNIDYVTNSSQLDSNVIEIDGKISECIKFKVTEEELVKAPILHQRPSSLVQSNPIKNKPKTNIHQKIILHQCPICPLQFSALDLKKHIRSHKGFKNYLNVPKINPRVKFYTNPRKSVALLCTNEIFHPCLYCDVKLRTEEFYEHVRNHRQQEIKCDKCNRVFGRMAHLKIHEHHHKKDFPYKCDICPKEFVLKPNFDCHMLLHKSEQLPFECDYCQKRFANPLYLKRHKLIHIENITYNQKYRSQKCATCLRGFKTDAELRKHACTGPPVQLPASKKKKYKASDGELVTKVRKKFKCKLCPKSYSASSSLYTHIQIIHEGRGRLSLCSICGRYVTNIQDHMMRHSGVKPHKCNICSKCFVAKRALKQHIAVHTGERPYVCTRCGKAFNNLYNLKVHERIHTGDKKYLCSICGRAFLEKSYLTKHIKVHKEVKDEIKFE